jgi:type II secretory pathway predicted ATPase ExeA
MIPQDVVMYEQVFDFNSRPFTAAPYVKHYFAGEAIQNALEQARLNVDRGAGPVLIVGATGTGKTLLLAMLESRYRDQIRVVNLACARLQERKDLLQSILHQLQLPFKGLSESELRFSLMDYLKPNPNCVGGIILLVDDADGLSSSLLDEMALITKFVADGQPRVRLVLAGSHRLEENLNEAKLESLNQRIAARCYLENMSRSETTRYLVEHIGRVGGDGERLFPEEACRAIHETTDGYPRLVNQVADHALMLAATGGMAAITQDCVREAWADVQSIPTSFQPQMPAVSDPANLSDDESWSVLEFGQLDGEATDETEVSVFPAETAQAHVANSSTEALDGISDQLLEDCEPSVGDLLPMDGEYEQSVGDTDIGNLELEQSQILEQVERERIEVYDADESFKDKIVVSSEEATGTGEVESVSRDVESLKNAQLNQNQEVVDPFQESFAEEEVLGDYFAPMVAQQNQASLSIRSADLTDLTPEDMTDFAGTEKEVVTNSGTEPAEAMRVELPTLVEAEYHEASQTDEPVETDNQRSSVEKSSLPEVPSGYEFMTGNDWTSNIANPSAAKPEPVVEPQQRQSTGKGVHVHGDDNVSRNIRRQAEGILGRLNTADSLLAEQVVGEAADCEGVDEIPATEGASPAEIEASGFNYQSAALDESQQILNEILEQRNALAQQGDSGVQVPPAERQLSDAQLNHSVTHQDEEKPIIVVSRTEETVEEKPTESAPSAPPTVPASTGKAARMDYQKLFEQLRDISNSQNS